MKPLVSIIVPIYNVEKYLRKCIDSILNQTLENIEVILVNDGSTDNSGKIIDEYKVRDSRVIAIHKENGGQSSARNIGLDIAKGKYIGFVDSDDWIDKDMYNQLVKKIEKSQSDICVCGRILYSENDTLLNKIEVKNETIDFNKQSLGEYTVNKLFYNHTVVVWNKIYKKDIIDTNKIRFKDVSYVGSEDALFNYSILCHVNKISSIDKVFYNQLERNGSTSRSYKYGYITRMSNLISSMHEYSKDINKENIGNEILPSILLFYNQWSISQIKLYSNETERYKILVNELKDGMSDDILRKYIKKLIIEKSMIEKMKVMGFKFKGRIVIKLFMTLCYLKRYNMASRLIISV